MSKPEFQLNDDEWSVDLERAYDEYMSNCESQLDFDEDEDDTPAFETLSGEPFCGCSTCYTREQLFFLVPRIIKGYKEGKVELLNVD